jgi:hypothetical protein
LKDSKKIFVTFENSNTSAYPNRAPAQGLNRSTKEVEALRARHAELEEEAKDLEHERNFYYGKLKKTLMPKSWKVQQNSQNSHHNRQVALLTRKILRH